MSKKISLKITAAFAGLALLSGVAFVGTHNALAQTANDNTSVYGQNRTPTNTTNSSSNTDMSNTNASSNTSNTSSSLTPSANSNTNTNSNSNSNMSGTGSTSGTSSTGTGTTGSTSVTPGVPNTGFGGDSAMNWIALFGSGLVAAAGITYLARYATGQ